MAPKQRKGSVSHAEAAPRRTGRRGEESDSESSSPDEAESSESEPEDHAEPQTDDEAVVLLMEAAAALESSPAPHARTGLAQVLAAMDQLQDGAASREGCMLLRAVWVDDPRARPQAHQLLRAVQEAAAGTAKALRGSATAAVRRMSGEGDTPQALWVVSSVAHCNGRYALQRGDGANGQPVWVRPAADGGKERVLFSTHTGRWRISDDPADIARGGGYVISEAEHRGAPPHLVQGWLRRLGERPCPQTSVTAPLSFDPGEAVAVFADEDGDRIELWACAPLGCGLVQYAVNGEPRPPCSDIEYDEDSQSVGFPCRELALGLPWRGFIAALEQIIAVAAAAGLDLRKMPRDPAREWLAEWNVERSAGRRSSHDAGRIFFHCPSNEETCWDLGRRLAAELKGGP